MSELHSRDGYPFLALSNSYSACLCGPPQKLRPFEFFKIYDRFSEIPPFFLWETPSQNIIWKAKHSCSIYNPIGFIFQTKAHAQPNRCAKCVKWSKAFYAENLERKKTHSSPTFCNWSSSTSTGGGHKVYVSSSRLRVWRRSSWWFRLGITTSACPRHWRSPLQMWVL